MTAPALVTVSQLAEHLGLHRQTVSRHLAQAVEMGLLPAHRMGQRWPFRQVANLYGTTPEELLAE